MVLWDKNQKNQTSGVREWGIAFGWFYFCVFQGTFRKFMESLYYAKKVYMDVRNFLQQNKYIL